MRRWISPKRSEARPIDTALRFLAQRPRTEYEVRERLRRAGVDQAAIDAAVGQLRQHGVEAATAEAAAAVVDDSAEADAYRAATRRAHQLAELDERAFKQRLGQFLARRGFDWDTIAAVVERLRSERSA